MTEKTPLYFCIHGHFYQPPRENPWTGAIEAQPSATPHHDWNQRIAKECYGPNSASRILDENGRIREIVNNYEHMSFNIGPTLMSWIRFEMPEVYTRIQEADRTSLQRLGHGNAIAQVYNHIIMPLASPQDRITQIEWGIQDFAHHFGRKPEAIWLAETAINMDTVVDLIHAGIRFTILSPTQAQAFRAFGEEEWLDCGNTDIDTTRPYRIYPRDPHGRLLCDGHLDVFFYNPGLSSAVGFEHLLRNADLFGSRIREAWRPDLNRAQLISVATDGESYGHHEPFGDMCAAWLFRHYASAHEMQPVNFGWFLEHFPPQHEVLLKNVHGEGCAWSCAHGVGRWYRDCGCSTGGGPDWNQKWRTPLREAMNKLKSAADELFVSEFPRLSDRDPWQIRNAYVDVLLHPGDAGVRDQFLRQWLLQPEDEGDRSAALLLLEIQKFCLFSFTSCGWFFNDIEGLEPIQNLRYAERAMELMRHFQIWGDNLETEFLGILARATGNETKRNGAEIFAAHVRQGIPAWLRLMGEAAVRLHLQLNAPQTFILEQARILILSHRKAEHQSIFQFRLEFPQSMETHEAGVLVMNDALERTHLFLVDGLEAVSHMPFPVDPSRSPTQIARGIAKVMHLRAKDLFVDSLVRINHLAAERNLKRFAEDQRDFARRYSMSLDCLADHSESLPGAMRESLAMALNAEVYRMILRALELVTDDLLALAKDLLEEARQLGIRIPQAGLGVRFHQRIRSLLAQVTDQQDWDAVNQITGLITLADWIHLDIDKTSLENQIYPAYQQYMAAPQHGALLAPMFAWLNFRLPDV
ncbi:MAG TPA: DUF3536 domain-containing protein [Fibrobacteraceae bacterium]|nr:DUF3536 domain-containing protein [Fibrobacteraceae bacterium]